MKKLNKIHLNKLTKFLLLVLIIVLYTLIMTIKFGVKDGPIVSILTWSFFVMCTPIADAGFLIDFPVRLLTGLKMIYSELIVWITAITITLITYFTKPIIYEKTVLLDIYKHILDNIFPYGIIIVLSCIGTFLSVYFGDELLETSINGKKRNKHIKHKKKLKFIIFTFLITLVIIIYYYILHQLGIKI